MILMVIHKYFVSAIIRKNEMSFPFEKIHNLIVSFTQLTARSR